MLPASVGAPALAAPTTGQQQEVNSFPLQVGSTWAPAGDGSACSAGEPPSPAPGAPTGLEDLLGDVLYHVLVQLGPQDVVHVKMCSKRLMGNILRACQHWAPKVESWLAADPSSARLLQQLRGTGVRQLQPPAQEEAGGDPAAASPGTAPGEGSGGSDSLAKYVLQQQQAAALTADEAEAVQIRAACGPGTARAVVAAEDDSSSYPGPTIDRAPEVVTTADEGLDWRQVWSCLERAQVGPWQLDARRLTPAAFPHGVLLTFELLLQQPAPPAEPGAREQQSGGWRDCVPVLTFTLDGKTVEIMVDASGKVTSPQRDWGQGSIKLQPGQPKLLALEVSYLFPVAAWFLHPCTLAAPKLTAGSRHGSFASSGSSSCASSLSCAAQDACWDSYSLTASSYGSSTSTAHSAALSSALSSLSPAMVASKGGGSGASSAGRPRLCLDLSHGFGSYVSDPRYIEESARYQKPRGIERMELAGRVCWRPSKVQSWLGRLLPGIRAHGCSSTAGTTGTNGTLSGGGPASCGTGAGSGGGSSSAGCVVGSPRRESSRPSFAVTVSKAAVWQVPEDPEYRFDEGFAFWAVQHKAEQLLEHYGILPAWQGRMGAGRG